MVEKESITRLPRIPTKVKKKSKTISKPATPSLPLKLPQLSPIIHLKPHPPHQKKVRLLKVSCTIKWTNKNSSATNNKRGNVKCLRHVCARMPLSVVFTKASSPLSAVEDLLFVASYNSIISLLNCENIKTNLKNTFIISLLPYFVQTMQKYRSFHSQSCTPKHSLL